MAVSKTGRSTWKIFWYHGIHDFKTGEPPVIIDSSKTKNQFTTHYYYFNNGFFNVDAAYKVDTVAPKRAKIEYEISTGKLPRYSANNDCYPVLDSLYKTTINQF
jgi:hypothetical protein